MPWVALDGGIGVGKTTVLDFMRRQGVSVLEEPVGDPSTQTRGPWDALLEDMYAGLPGAAFAFQMRVVQDRALSDAVVETGQALTSWGCMERSPDMQRRTFVRMQSFDEAQKHEIEEAYDTAASLWRPAAIIYLRASPKVSFDRMKRRARSSEATVALKYHQELYDMHDLAVMDLHTERVVPVHCIDVDGMTTEEVGVEVMRVYRLVQRQHAAKA